MNVKKFFRKYFKFISAGVLGVSVTTAVALSVPAYAFSINTEGNLVADNLYTGSQELFNGEISQYVYVSPGWYTLSWNHSISGSMSLVIGGVSFDTWAFSNVGRQSGTFYIGNYTSIAFRYYAEENIFAVSDIMLNKGQVAMDYEPYGVWYSQGNYTTYGANQYNSGYTAGMVADNDLKRNFDSATFTFSDGHSISANTYFNWTRYGIETNQFAQEINDYFEQSGAEYCTLSFKLSTPVDFTGGVIKYGGYTSVVTLDTGNSYINVSNASTSESGTIYYMYIQDQPTDFYNFTYKFYSHYGSPDLIINLSPSYTSGYVDGQEVGYNRGYNNGYDTGYEQGTFDTNKKVDKSSESYKQGVSDADSTLNKNSVSYNSGFDNGYIKGSTETNNLRSMLY